MLLTVTASGGAVQTVTATGYAVTWATNTYYTLGDTVLFGVNTYICISSHTSGSSSRPDNDTTGLIDNLGSLGYISTLVDGLPSTIEGLGTVGYVSSLDLASTTAGIEAELISSSAGLIDNLGSLGYISTLVDGLPSTGLS